MGEYSRPVPVVRNKYPAELRTETQRKRDGGWVRNAKTKEQQHALAKTQTCAGV